MPTRKTAKERAKAFFDMFTKGRPQPTAPRAGFRVSGSRYTNGGKITRKKTV